ncbi:MAG: ABC transporter ATP-binding protein [Lachnospiraceae bacterium]|nr:ABC transporter ATP-binding protein [Lachnospiraceae bacterium]
MAKEEYEFGQAKTGPRRHHGPMARGPVEKAGDFKGTWKKLLEFNKKYVPAIIIAIIAAGFGTVLTIIGPDKLKELTNVITEGIMTGIDMDKVKTIGFTLAAFYAGSMVLTLIQHMIMAIVTQRVSQGLRYEISRKINRLPMSYFGRTQTGDILSRVTNDVDTIGQSFNQSIGNLVSSVTLFIGSLIMMAKTNVILTLTAIGATIIGFILMFMIMGKSQKYFARQQLHLGEINGHVEEMFAGHTVVKAYNGEKEAVSAFDTMNENLRDSAFKAQCLAGLMPPIMGFIGNFGYVAVCVAGSVLTMKGKADFGVIVAFMLYIRYFTQPLNQLAQVAQSLQSAAAAGERVFVFLEAQEMEDESGKKQVTDKGAGEVVFSHVKFGYPGTDKEIIHDFSAVAKPGQKVAIVGPTGAGKTTLVNLLMRFYEIDGGEITIDGVSTKEYTREQLHDRFCMVLQDTWLFEGTVRDNLAYSSEGVTDADLDRVCKAVGLRKFINTLPNGYDTILNDNVNLSQGQRQQLTIARAMLSDRSMLILDEATSSVDTRTELKIQKAMDELTSNRTSFVIAHRLSTIKNSDLILVLKDGDVIESGNHEELLAKNGFYADLYMSQFEEERK